MMKTFLSRVKTKILYYDNNFIIINFNKPFFLKKNAIFKSVIVDDDDDDNDDDDDDHNHDDDEEDDDDDDTYNYDNNANYVYDAKMTTITSKKF